MEINAGHDSPQKYGHSENIHSIMSWPSHQQYRCPTNIAVRKYLWDIDTDQSFFILDRGASTNVLFYPSGCPSKKRNFMMEAVLCSVLEEKANMEIVTRWVRSLRGVVNIFLYHDWSHIEGISCVHQDSYASCSRFGRLTEARATYDNIPDENWHVTKSNFSVIYLKHVAISH